MRISASSLVIRFTSSLSSLLPGTTTLALRIDSRVSSESEALYLPLVWHSAQRALISGAISCAKSIGLGASAGTGVTTPTLSSQATSQTQGRLERDLMTFSILLHRARERPFPRIGSSSDRCILPFLLLDLERLLDILSPCAWMATTIPFLADSERGHGARRGAVHHLFVPG